MRRVQCTHCSHVWTTRIPVGKRIACTKCRRTTQITRILPTIIEYDMDLNWTTDALCATRSPDEYFPNTVSRMEAQQLCHGCPVTNACLIAALIYEEGKPRAYRFGVWGGTTPQERSRLTYRTGTPEELNDAV